MGDPEEALGMISFVRAVQSGEPESRLRAARAAADVV